MDIFLLVGGFQSIVGFGRGKGRENVEVSSWEVGLGNESLMFYCRGLLSRIQGGGRGGEVAVRERFVSIGVRWLSWGHWSPRATVPACKSELPVRVGTTNERMSFQKVDT